MAFLHAVFLNCCPRISEIAQFEESDSNRVVSFIIDTGACDLMESLAD